MSKQRMPVDLMEDTRTTLLPRYAPKQDHSSQHHVKSPPESQASLENSFTALEVKGPSKMESLEANAIAAQTESSQDYELESPTLEEDKKSDKLLPISVSLMVWIVKEVPWRPVNEL